MMDEREENPALSTHLRATYAECDIVPPPPKLSKNNQTKHNDNQSGFRLSFLLVPIRIIIYLFKLPRLNINWSHRNLCLDLCYFEIGIWWLTFHHKFGIVAFLILAVVVVLVLPRLKAVLAVRSWFTARALDHLEGSFPYLANHNAAEGTSL